MWQNIIVYIIGVAVLAYICVRVYRAAKRRKDPCSGCCGCAPRDRSQKTGPGDIGHVRDEGDDDQKGGCCGCR